MTFLSLLFLLSQRGEKVKELGAQFRDGMGTLLSNILHYLTLLSKIRLTYNQVPLILKGLDLEEKTKYKWIHFPSILLPNIVLTFYWRVWPNARTLQALLVSFNVFASTNQCI